MNGKRKKHLAASALGSLFLISVLTCVDQLTKYWAESWLKSHSLVTLIQGVLELRYLENRGIAFGMFQGRIFLFLFLCILFFIAALYCFIKLPKTTYYFPILFILILMVAGGLGNFIDRVYRGFVVDFIYFSLIDFPIFNLADVYVVLGGILLVLFVCLKYKEEDFKFLTPGKKG